MRSESDEMKLTAYALGELGGAERDAVEARLNASPDDRRFVDDVRQAARVVSDELARETPSSLDAIHYAAIEMRLREPYRMSRPIDAPAIGARIGFTLTLAASVTILCGAVGAVLYSLSRHNPVVGVDAPSKSPLLKPILIPLEPFNVAENHSGPGIPRPAGGGAGPFVSVSDQAVSSFVMNADAASYDDLRHALIGDRLPDRASVRIEGLINAFTYDDPAPEGPAAFAGSIEVGKCPWQADHQLARIAVKAKAGTGAVAENVRTEVAFNPAAAKSWRLIGYDDTAAGSGTGETIAGGHAVTALYEVVPVSPAPAPGNLLTLRLRYHAPGVPAEQVAEFAGAERANPKGESDDFRFAAAVAEFGLLLRDKAVREGATVASVIQLAEAARGQDPAGQRREFIDLVNRAKPLLG